MAETGDDAQKPHGLSGLLTRLRESARAFVRAEIEYVIADLGVRTSAVMPAVFMVMMAIVLSCSVVTSVLIGLIIALGPYLSIWGSLGLVAAIAMLIAVLLVRRAIAIVRAVRQPEGAQNEAND